MSGGSRPVLSLEVAVMCEVAQWDIRTVTGSNLALIMLETGMDPVHGCLGKMRQIIQFRVDSVPVVDKWRLEYLAKLLT